MFFTRTHGHPHCPSSSDTHTHMQSSLRAAKCLVSSRIFTPTEYSCFTYTMSVCVDFHVYLVLCVTKRHVYFHVYLCGSMYTLPLLILYMCGWSCAPFLVMCVCSTTPCTPPVAVYVSPYLHTLMVLMAGNFSGRVNRQS